MGIAPLYSVPMAASYLRILLVLEIAALAALAFWLHASQGWGYGALAMLALGLSTGIRLLIVCAGVAISSAARSPRAREHQIGPTESVVLLLRGWHSILSTNYWQFPFDRWFLRPDPPASASTTPPVLFVHGYFSNRGYFNRIVPRLEARGIAPVFTPNFPSAFTTIERFAEALHGEIERLCMATGQPQVVLVCHSMGGLVARTYLCDHGADRVRKLITIGTPHHGTVIACFGGGANAVQMRPGSAYLRALEVREGGAGPGCRTTSIFTPHDNLVAPQESSRLPNARNVVIPGRGHVDILESRRLLEVVIEELRGAG
jgi:triacylglycerol esterase/lipase EstA (alpha/beta hydrolase family)